MHPPIDWPQSRYRNRFVCDTTPKMALAQNSNSAMTKDRSTRQTAKHIAFVFGVVATQLLEQKTPQYRWKLKRSLGDNAQLQNYPDNDPEILNTLYWMPSRICFQQWQWLTWTCRDSTDPNPTRGRDKVAYSVGVCSFLGERVARIIAKRNTWDRIILQAMWVTIDCVGRLRDMFSCVVE